MSGQKRINLTLLNSPQSHIMKKKKQQSGFFQKTKGFFTNLIYGGEKAIQKVQTIFQDTQSKQQTIIILGKRYTSLEQAKKDHQKLIWVTYRSNFIIFGNIKSDVGFGCLIRVGQMMFAHSLKKHFEYNGDKIEDAYIITGLLDESGFQSKYSLNKIVEYLYKVHRKVPGSWCNISEVSYALQTLQRNQPLKGAENLKIAVFNDSLIYIDDVFKKLNKQICSCIKRRIKCQICQRNLKKSKISLSQLNNAKSVVKSPNSTISQKNQAILASHYSPCKQIPENHVLMIISARLGLNGIDKTPYDILLRLMQLSQFAGYLGGFPGKAIFITGKYNNKVSYLDPHYFQKAVHRTNLNKQINTYFCDSYLLADRTSLDPTMGLCFFIKNPQDLEDLINQITQIKMTYGGFFLDFKWQNPFKQYANKSFAKKEKKEQDKDGNFDDYDGESVMSNESSIFVI